MKGEYKKKVLTPADHARFLRDGYLVVKGAVPARTAAAVARSLERPRGSRYVSGPLVEACSTPKVLAAVGELMGEGGVPKKRLTIDEPRALRPDGFWSDPRAHTDVDDPCLMPDGWALAVFIFLTKVRSRGGAFVCFPGSHARLRRLTAADPGRLKELEGLPEHSGRWKEFLAEPGDLVIFHHLFGHCGSENVSDPATRHALLSRVHPRGRVVPGDKPFAAMTTLEKANSSRWQAAREKRPFPVVLLERDGSALERSLRDGEGTNLLAHAELNAGGAIRRFSVEASSPSVVRQSESRGWLDRRELPPLELPGETVRALSVFRQGPDAVLFVSAARGTRVFASADLETWRDLGVLPESGASGLYLGAYLPGAAGFAAISPAAGGGLALRLGQDWSAALSAAPRRVSPARGPALRDVSIRPVRGEMRFGFVAESADGGILAAESPRAERLERLLRPLPGAAGAEQLRVLSRARDYWLTSRLETRGGRRVLLWGAVDWSGKSPRLEPLEDARSLRVALQTVGLI